MPLLKVSATELNLAAVLLNGQSFRWVCRKESYYGTAHARLWRLRRKNKDEIEYTVLARKLSEKEDDDDNIMKKYLQLDVDLTSLYDVWSAGDCHIHSLLLNRPHLKGIRILDQEPLETLFAFICSSNNNIKRISKMVNRICTLYGQAITLSYPMDSMDKAVIDSNPFLTFLFPTLNELTSHVETMESQLRLEGFGYRAGYIRKTVEKLSLIGTDTLLLLREKDLNSAREILRSFTGVGPKVADCISLMSLRKHSVVPIDTHVYKATLRVYKPSLVGKVLNDKLHKELGKFYKAQFGEYAGWAQAIIFNSQLAEKKSDSPQTQSRKSKNPNNLH